MTETANINLLLAEGTDLANFLNPANENMQKIDVFAGKTAMSIRTLSVKTDNNSSNIRIAEQAISNLLTSVEDVNSSVNRAQESANTANLNANNAKRSADAAQITANAAKETANAVKETVDAIAIYGTAAPITIEENKIMLGDFTIENDGRFLIGIFGHTIIDSDKIVFPVIAKRKSGTTYNGMAYLETPYNIPDKIKSVELWILKSK